MYHHPAAARSSSIPPEDYYESMEVEQALRPEEYGQPGPSMYYPDQYPQPQPYQPGQYLETIHTGETLQIQEQPSPPRNPFDPRLAWGSHDSLPYGSQSYPSYDSHASPYSTSHEGIIDPFQHDTEAYASGANLHTYPRSRSPTPAVDDEDYYVVGNDSFHYTGEPRPYSDPEKAALSSSDLHYNYHDPPPSHSFEEMDVAQSPHLSTPVETRHFGSAPAGRVARRINRKKAVRLKDGKIYSEALSIPDSLVLPRKGEREMMEMQYTAVTCDPDDFDSEGYVLRQTYMGRRTELLVVVTMYNEDEVLFCRTLYGVMKNIQHLCTRKNSQTWGADAWKKVVVCIVADGRMKVHPRVLDCLALLGVYQLGPMKNAVLGQEVTAHVFEYTTSFGLDPNLHFKYPDKGIVPTQIIFCLKEKNQKKINSHRWAFNAFARQLQPNVCILLDVGTRPSQKSLYKLWKVFDTHSNVAGACGEISTYKGKNWSLLLNPLVAAQNFEYKISCILDKPTESLFGYISVLPGAFSAYRYIALQNDEKGVGPLASYFKGEVLHGRDTDIFTSNMVLKYVKGAVGETDVPDALPEFIGQRRRWLNGSFFAATYAIAHAGQIMRSGHSFTRKTVLMVETVYNIINLCFAWFGIGNFYLFFVVLTSSLESKYFGFTGIEYFNTIIQYALVLMIAACFLFCMGNKPRASTWKYKFAVIFFSVLMIYMLFASILCAIAAGKQGGAANSAMLYSVVITYGMYATASVLAFDPWHMITSFVSYLLLSPTYINILNMQVLFSVSTELGLMSLSSFSSYAFSNLDDISWGTKEDSVVQYDLGAVVQKEGSRVVNAEFPETMPDAETVYQQAISNLRKRNAPPPKQVKGKGPVKRVAKAKTVSNAEREQAAKDYYANVRTNVLLTWVISNVLLIVAILKGTEASGTFDQGASVSRTKGYLIFILVFTTLSNLIRFGGSTMYLL
ncbi:hypothetical protein V5O48_004970, partial [Marasmius crinis-equi]